MASEPARCPGPLIWYDVPSDGPWYPAAILECARCPYLIVSGNFSDEAHGETPILREGLVA